jgi:hypothetical protein
VSGHLLLCGRLHFRGGLRSFITEVLAAGAEGDEETRRPAALEPVLDNSALFARTQD